MRRFFRVLVALMVLLSAPARAEDGGRLIEYERVEAAGLPPQRLTMHHIEPARDQNRTSATRCSTCTTGTTCSS